MLFDGETKGYSARKASHLRKSIESCGLTGEPRLSLTCMSAILSLRVQREWITRPRNNERNR